MLNSKTDRIDIECNVIMLMNKSMGIDNSRNILTSENSNGKTVMDEIVDTVMITSNYTETGNYSTDDVRFAIGNVLTTKILAS